jgi:hypothetical protein
MKMATFPSIPVFHFEIASGYSDLMHITHLMNEFLI